MALGVRSPGMRPLGVGLSQESRNEVQRLRTYAIMAGPSPGCCTWAEDQPGFTMTMLPRTVAAKVAA